MTITVQEITDRAQWNAFHVQQLHGHLLQSYEWGELHRYLGGKVYRLGALEDQTLVGAMQLFVAPVPLPQFHLSWLYSARGPTLSRTDPSILNHLLEAAHKIARQERAVVLRLEPNIADDDPLHDRWLAIYHRAGFRSNPHTIHARRAWVLDIRPDADELLLNFKMTWRQNVRSAGRKGVVIREVQTNHDSFERDVAAYYQLLKLTSERDAFFIHPAHYHHQMLRQFSSTGDIALFLAEHEGQPLAAKVLIRFGSWCWDMFGASSNEKRNLKATYLLQFHCIQWAQAQGCTHFDFRAIPDKLEPGADMWGVYEYKKGFGGYSRLNLPTQDYVYQPLTYTLWRQVVEIRRNQRNQQRRQVEFARSHRGQQKQLVTTVTL